MSAASESKRGDAITQVIRRLTGHPDLIGYGGESLHDAIAAIAALSPAVIDALSNYDKARVRLDDAADNGYRSFTNERRLRDFYAAQDALHDALDAAFAAEERPA